MCDIAFFAMPRCASTSMRTWITDTKVDIIRHNKLSNRDLFIQYNKIFTFVRNPYTRLQSAYNIQRTCTKHLDMTTVEGVARQHIVDRIKSSESFESFALALPQFVEEMKEHNPTHFYPQSAWIYEKGRCLVTRIGRFETLEKDFQDICISWGVKCCIGKRRINKTNHREQLTPKAKRVVYEFYRDDFINFGYKA